MARQAQSCDIGHNGHTRPAETWPVNALCPGRGRCCRRLRGAGALEPKSEDKNNNKRLRPDPILALGASIERLGARMRRARFAPPFRRRAINLSAAESSFASLMILLLVFAIVGPSLAESNKLGRASFWVAAGTLLGFGVGGIIIAPSGDSCLRRPQPILFNVYLAGGFRALK